jgi:hypothetical protein
MNETDFEDVIAEQRQGEASLPAPELPEHLRTQGCGLIGPCWD